MYRKFVKMAFKVLVRKLNVQARNKVLITVKIKVPGKNYKVESSPEITYYQYRLNP